jgi:hypothetical protein
MKAPMSKATLLAFACAFATACAGPTHDVTQLQRAQYAIDEGTASVLVRDALAGYPLVERGNGQFETRWLQGRGGDVYQFVVHIDGPGGGPFMVTVETKMREKYHGHAITETVDAPPAYLAKQRDKLVVGIYERMKQTVVVQEAPSTVAVQ